MLMHGLQFDIEGIYFCCFRQPVSTGVILTYPIPPFTTIRGLVECALGFPRDSFFLQDKIKIGIMSLNNPERATELSKILKFVSRQKETTYQKAFPSAPIFRSFLVNPMYRIFVTGEEALLKEISEGLQNPARPCYLGQSDDMVDFRDISVVEIKKVKSDLVSSVIEGVHDNCEIVRLSYKFRKKGTVLETKTVSVPRSIPLSIKGEIDCWNFNQDNIVLF
jgi:CRISPR-associated protein Cas5h